MDFQLLSEKIEKAAKKAFLEMYEQHGSEQIYAFALYSDDGAETLCPSTNTLKGMLGEEEFEAYLQGEALEYYEFETAEWAYEYEGGRAEFREICGILSEAQYDDFQAYREQFFEVCVAVLHKLKKENFFKNIVQREIFLTFAVSDSDWLVRNERKIIPLLNDEFFTKQYFLQQEM